MHGIEMKSDFLVYEKSRAAELPRLVPPLVFTVKDTFRFLVLTTIHHHSHLPKPRNHQSVIYLPHYLSIYLPPKELF
jgi:hypothetical protein